MKEWRIDKTVGDAVNKQGYLFQESMKAPMTIRQIKDMIECGGMWVCECKYENFALMGVCPFCGVEKLDV